MPRALLTLADLKTQDLHNILSYAEHLRGTTEIGHRISNQKVYQEDSLLRKKAIGLLFTKRSTRTRVTGEVAINRLGGHPIFLSPADIQLGVNETLRDTASVLNQLVQGLFARVGDHSEIEELAKYTSFPVINALSSLWHPTQVLADLLTVRDLATVPKELQKPDDTYVDLGGRAVRPLTVSWVGDSSNILHDMLVSYPRLGFKLRVATPPKYRAPSAVWERVEQLDCAKGIHWTDDPREAVHGADIVVTDTWISMGQEAEKTQRLKDFHGYQVTEQLCKEGGANPDWKLMHCLPRKTDEVDDEVFYGPRSVVWQEAANRIEATQAVFAMMYQEDHTNPTEDQA
ncbi:ornithine carbamoyltransferase 1 [Auriculariales sp. MPI-PUGE-AT-0066]|nr:ornithine carbamoyltransferase 1 [Auriculariales sp. MPI-PUGE-AT-0066]